MKSIRNVGESAENVLPILQRLPDGRFESVELTATKMYLKVVTPRVEYEIAPGDVLTLPLRSGVLPVEIVALPSRRGPAAEARACYSALDGRGASAIAGGDTAPEEGPAQP